VAISSTRSVIARSAATWQSHQPAPSLRGAQRRGNLIVLFPSPLMGEGEDEGEILLFTPRFSRYYQDKDFECSISKLHWFFNLFSIRINRLIFIKIYI